MLVLKIAEQTLHGRNYLLAPKASLRLVRILVVFSQTTETHFHFMFTQVLELNPNIVTFCSFIKGHYTLCLLILVELIDSIIFNSIDRLSS